MRAMFMVVASIILAVGLFGCNRQQQVAEQAPAAAAPPPAAAVPPPPSAPAVEATRHVRRHHHAHARDYASYRESETSSYEDYSETGSSSVSYEQSGERSEAGAEVHGDVWVDGYGREHTGVATPDDNPGAIDAHDERLRHRVWRGWNSDCDRR